MSTFFKRFSTSIIFLILPFVSASNLSTLQHTLLSNPDYELYFSIEEQFTDKMDALRMMCFPKNVHQISSTGKYTSRDEFDERSKHIIICTNAHEVVAYTRLTPSIAGVFETWTKGEWRVSEECRSIDCVRFAIHPNYRAKILYNVVPIENNLVQEEISLSDVLTLLIIQYSKENNYQQILGGVIPGRGLINKFYQYGFKDSGKPLKIHIMGQQGYFIQPIIYEINRNVDGTHLLGIKKCFAIVNNQLDSQKLRSNL